MAPLKKTTLLLALNPTFFARSGFCVAAKVYAVSPHTGRGGWTWYNQSADWLYRLIVESLLGLRLEKDKLRFESCLSAPLRAPDVRGQWE